MKVLITGASSGIGAAAAKTFAKHGYDLVLAGRDEARLTRVAESLEGVSVTLFKGDLTKRKAYQKLYSGLQGDTIDVLINCAGAGYCGAFLDGDLDRQTKMMRLNNEALIRMTYMFGKDMVQRGKGHIINICSTAAFVPGPYMAVYYATKAFVLSFSQALAEELKDTGVHVSCLCPGAVDTAFQEKAGQTSLGTPLTAGKAAEAVYRLNAHPRAVKILGASGYALDIAARVFPRSLIRSVAGRVNRGRQV